MDESRREQIANARQAEVLWDIMAERRRQDAKWGANRKQAPEIWMAILMEEVGEVAETILAERPLGTWDESVLTAIALIGRAAKGLLNRDHAEIGTWLAALEMLDRTWLDQEHDQADRGSELTQVAAVAVAWLETRQPPAVEIIREALDD